VGRGQVLLSDKKQDVRLARPTEPSFSLGIGIQCHCAREVSRGSQLTVSDPKALTYYVVLPEPCGMCGETRVRAKMGIGM
jgi:hypothetical protein